MRISEHIKWMKEALRKYGDIEIKINNDTLYVSFWDYPKCRLEQLKREGK